MMPMLRSNFPAGTTRWAVRRAQWKAMGITEDDFAKPKIAVVNSSSGLSVCFAHLDELARLVAAEIRAAGGLNEIGMPGQATRTACKAAAHGSAASVSRPAAS